MSYTAVHIKLYRGDWKKKTSMGGEGGMVIFLQHTI